MNSASVANLTQYIPLAVVLIVSFMLVKEKRISIPMLILILILGVLLGDSPFGALINQELSRFSGGYL